MGIRGADFPKLQLPRGSVILSLASGIALTGRPRPAQRGREAWPLLGSEEPLFVGTFFPQVKKWFHQMTARPARDANDHTRAVSGDNPHSSVGDRCVSGVLSMPLPRTFKGQVLDREEDVMQLKTQPREATAWPGLYHKTYQVYEVW